MRRDRQITVLLITALATAALVFYPIKIQYFGIEDICKNLFFMVFGALIASLQNSSTVSLSKSVSFIVSGMLFGCSVALYCMFYRNDLAKFLMAVFMLVSLMAVAEGLKNKGARFFAYISKNVFTIYIYSWIFQSVAELVLTRLQVNWLLMVPVMFIAGIGFPLMIVFTYKKLKKLNCRFFNLCLGIR